MHRLRVDLPDRDFIEVFHLASLIAEAMYPRPENAEGLSCIVGKRVQFAALQKAEERSAPTLFPLPSSGSQQIETEPNVAGPSDDIIGVPPDDCLNGETQDATDSTPQTQQREHHTGTAEHDSSLAGQETLAGDGPGFVSPLTDQERSAVARVLPRLPRLYGRMTIAEIGAFLQAFHSLPDSPKLEPVIKTGEESLTTKDQRWNALLEHQRSITRAVELGQLRAIERNRTPTTSAHITDLLLREDAKQYLTRCGFDVTPKEVSQADSERPSITSGSSPPASDGAALDERDPARTHERERARTDRAVSEEPIPASATPANDQQLPEPAVPPDSALLALGESKSHSRREQERPNRSVQRKNELTSPIVEAQSRCRDPNNTSEVWLALRKLVDQKVEPFCGITEDDDVKWQDRKGKTNVLTFAAFEKRLKTVRKYQ